MLKAPLTAGPAPRRALHGWDVGGAHLKIARLDAAGRVEVGQWPCPLWTGLAALDAALDAACTRWPDLPEGAHALTMSGEMVDAFPDRAAGVQALVAHLAARLRGPLRVYAGEGPAGRWCQPAQAGRRWADVASANWQATAAWVARTLPEALLIDVGSTTSDLIVLRAGRLVEAGASDAERLHSGALVYQGVVRTPLCALGPSLPVAGRETGLMNEFFATTADVYRLLGMLDPAHDQQPAADGGAKEAAGSRQRLARMVGRDAAELPAEAWQALAAAFRARQLERLAGPLDALVSAHGLPPQAPIVAAGCGAFLAQALAVARGRPLWRLAATGPQPWPAGAPPLAGEAAWASVAAPSLAVAQLALADEEN